VGFDQVDRSHTPSALGSTGLRNRAECRSDRVLRSKVEFPTAFDSTEYALGLDRVSSDETVFVRGNEDSGGRIWP
jgi:hypothetical protein